ncbi:MAG: DNA internalization-related competence protein ComEC/Rec2 [Mariprofundales bacterium]|nr:DNA internalization-related competence protein ComEC/Rec2 [Mariprofundales bacterium]
MVRSPPPVSAQLPLLWYALLWVAGVVLVVLLPDLAVCWLLLALMLLLIWWRVRWHPLLLLLAAILWASALQGWLDWQQRVDGSWLEGLVVVDATVAGVQQTAHRTRLLLQSVKRSDGRVLHGDIWLYLYGKQRLYGVMAGDHLHGALRLHLPRSRHNPGGFDFRSYCRLHHVVLLGSAAERLSLQPDPTMLAGVRQRVRNSLSHTAEEERAIIAALLLADRSQLSDQQWQLFAASGTAHLLAISGLHIGMVAGWGFLLVWWLLTRREAWIVHLPVRRCALVAGLLFAVGYATLAGWSLPTERAVLMLAAAVVAWWLRSRSHPLNTMLAALMVVVLFDPSAVVSISLWLSFVAVTALLIWSMQMDPVAGRGWRASLHALLWVSVIASLATLPLVAGMFGILPIYSLPANLLLVPLYGLWILPSSLMAALLAIIGWSGGAHGLFALAAVAVSAGQKVLASLYQLPGGSWWLPQLPVWWLLLLSLLLAVAGWIWWQRKRLAALTLLLSTLLALVAWPESRVEQTQWTAWDVGQGAAATIRFADGEVMLIDAPGSRGSRFNGGSTVADGLRAQGVTHVDVVVVSHLQSDHAGGVATLLRRINHVDELWLADLPESRHAPQVRLWRRQLHRLGGDIRWLTQGDRLSIGGHDVQVLWPPRHVHSANANNSSLVLSITLAGDTKMLAMGDSEALVERQLVAAGIGHHDLLLVPHHGSRSSSTYPFVQRVTPVVAVMQTGFGNRYHFPDPAVVRRYRALGAAVVNTANGAVVGEVRHHLRWQQMGGDLAKSPWADFLRWTIVD